MCAGAGRRLALTARLIGDPGPTCQRWDEPATVCRYTDTLTEQHTLSRTPSLVTHRYALHGESALPDWATHFWLVEMDVGWTGSLLSALHSVLTITDGAQPPA